MANAQHMGFQLVGTNNDEKFNHLVALSGVSPAYAGEVRLSTTYNEISIYIPGGSRTLKLERGKPAIYNALYFPPELQRGNGQAVDQYARSALAARAAGVSKISVSGAGNGNGRDGPQSDDSTGYHVWPTFGYDGKMDDASTRGAAHVRGAHPELENVTTFNEAFFHPNPDARREARAAWQQHGGGMPKVTLNLEDTNSSSWRNFTSHVNHTQRRSGRTMDTINLTTALTRNGGYENP